MIDLFAILTFYNYTTNLWKFGFREWILIWIKNIKMKANLWKQMWKGVLSMQVITIKQLFNRIFDILSMLDFPSSNNHNFHRQHDLLITIA
jgi:hypothetical protein